MQHTWDIDYHCARNGAIFKIPHVNILKLLVSALKNKN